LSQFLYNFQQVDLRFGQQQNGLKHRDEVLFFVKCRYSRTPAGRGIYSKLLKGGANGKRKGFL
jgi:hypothetical protein